MIKNLVDPTPYERALQDWLHEIPTDELPPLIDEIVSEFRAGKCSETSAKTRLEKYRFLIEQWIKHNGQIHKNLFPPSSK